MAATVFATPANNVSSSVGTSGYLASSGSLTLAVGGGSQFPSLSGGNFCRVTVIKKAYAYTPNAPSSTYTIYKVTAVTGDILTINSVLDGTTDRNYSPGDIVEIRDTAGTYSDIHTAVNTLENTPTVNTSLTLADAVNVAVGTGTGTKIATSSSQKLGFFGATPVAQQSGDIASALGNFGLVTTPTISSTSTVNFDAICSGRLTLTSVTPYSDSQSGTTLYFTPYLGNTIALYDGSANWNLLTFVETSIAINSTTGLYDVFAYNNSGVLGIELSAKWTSTGNNTAAAGVRATALATVNGVYVKNGATTRRYLGTIYSASGTTTDSPVLRGLWNYNNRLPHRVAKVNSGSSWSYTTALTWRASNNDSTNSVQVVSGLQDSSSFFTGTSGISPTDAHNAGAISLGFDSTTVTAADTPAAFGNIVTFFTGTATWNSVLPIGLHTIYLIEMTIYSSGSSASCLFLGPAATYGYNNCGVFGSVFC